MSVRTMHGDFIDYKTKNAHNWQTTLAFTIDARQQLARLLVFLIYIASVLQQLQRLATSLSRYAITDAAARFIDAHGEVYRFPIDMVSDWRVCY